MNDRAGWHESVNEGSEEMGTVLTCNGALILAAISRRMEVVMAVVA